MICAARPASMPTRNDPRCSPQGQGKPVHADPSTCKPDRACCRHAGQARSESGAWRAPMPRPFVVCTTATRAARARRAAARRRSWQDAVPHARCARLEDAAAASRRLPNRAPHARASSASCADGASAVRAADARRQADARARRSRACAIAAVPRRGFDADDCRGARSKRSRAPRWPPRRRCRSASRSQPPPPTLRAIDVHGGRRVDLDAPSPMRCRQPPRALARPRCRPTCSTASRYRARPAALARARRLVVPLLRRARARDASAPAPSSPCRARTPTATPASCGCATARAARARAPHRAGRQGHLLRHRRHQPQAPQEHARCTATCRAAPWRVGTLLALRAAQAPARVDCWLAITENHIGPTRLPPAGRRARR